MICMVDREIISDMIDDKIDTCMVRIYKSIVWDIELVV